MKKKHGWLKVLAVIAAIAGVAVAVAAFLKKKGKRMKEELDFDEQLYFDGEADLFEDDIMNGDETVAPDYAGADDDMAPEESEDYIADGENRAEE